MGVAMFAAFESHMINIEAHVEKATYLNTTQIDLGTVFPQENLIVGCFATGPEGGPATGLQEDIITPVGPADCPVIRLSHSFKAQSRVLDVHYDVYWVDKPCIPKAGDGDPETTGDTKKCEGLDESDIILPGRTFPPGDYIEHDICRFMQIFDSDPADGNDVIEVGSPWNCQPEPTPGNPSLVASGTLITNLDEYDIWDLVYWVPVCVENFNPETDPGPNPPPGISPTTPDCWDPENVGGSYGETDQSNELKFQITAYSFGP
jgi:hypothetical protein